MQPQVLTEPDAAAPGIARELARRFHLPTTLVKFLIVGGIGYVINQGVLFLLYDTSLGGFLPAKHTHDHLLLVRPEIRLLVSIIVAVEIAIVAQFSLHDRWTFRDRRQDGWIGARFAKFNLSSIVSPIIIVVTVNVLTPVFGISPYISNTIGVALGVAWNWFLNSLVIWPQHRPAAGTGEAAPR